MGPSWERQEVESMVAIIQNCANSVAELKVLLEGSQRERVSLEDKLRRAKMLLSDRQMMLDDSAAEVAKCVEDLRSVKRAIAKKSELVTELEVASSDSEALSHLKREITNDEATCEKLIFHQGMEERTVARSQKVVLACEVDTIELSDQLESTIKRHTETEHRVSSMEKLVHAMTCQLARMQDGGGAAFFPRPILGSPETPLVTVHTLNACPVCSLWFSSYDYAALGCGHTYHPYCLFEHSQGSSTCLLKTCGKPFDRETIEGIGIRLAVEAPNNARKKAEGLQKDAAVSVSLPNSSGNFSPYFF